MLRARLGFLIMHIIYIHEEMPIELSHNILVDVAIS